MPEPYWPKRKGAYRLSDAEKNARYARVRCGYCKMTRYFLVRELRVAFGDVQVDDVVYQKRWRCTKCNTEGMLEITLDDPRPGDNAVVRRLERVDYIRRPIWRDETG